MEDSVSLRVLDIIPGTSVDGVGLRTSVYFAGCDHHCPGCHNPQSWDFEGGKDMSIEHILDIIEENGFNVTFTGGDPVYQLPELTELARAIVAKGLDIWMYTGFKFEQLLKMMGAKELLNFISVVVDGEFIIAERDVSLSFRGSANQRLIDVVGSLALGKVKELDL